MARHGELKAAAKRASMNSHDDWFAAILDFQKERRQLYSSASFARSDFAEFLDVRAGNESFSAAYQHGRFDGFVFVDLLNRGSNAFRHARTESIHRGIIDGDDGDAVVFSKLNEVAHKWPLFLWQYSSITFYGKTRPHRSTRADTCLIYKASHLRLANSGRIVSCPPQYFFRSSLFRILPVPVFGRLSKNSTDRGTL